MNMNKWCGLYVFLFVLAALAPLLRADQFAAHNGQTPTPPYGSWGDAASNIQEAVSAAPVGGTVWVTNGTYTVMPGSNNVVYINKSLTLRGAGASAADVIINGGGAYRGVYINLTTPATVILDGLTITNCRLAAQGAGVYLFHTNINVGTGIIQNCEFRNNEGLGSGVFGGAVHSYGQAANPNFYTLLSNCVFAGNSASNGGAVYLYSTRADVLDCQATVNVASNAGGAFYMIGAGASTFFQRCTIASNICRINGGGLYVQSASEVVLDNCRIDANQAQGGANTGGGGIFTRANLFLTNCIVRNNSATQGAGTCAYMDTPYFSLFNSLVANNVSANGGAVYGVNQSTGTYVIVNSTIASNYTVGSGGAGGFSILGISAMVEVRNSIVYHNIRADSAAKNNYTFSDGLGLKRFYQSATFPFPTSYDGGGNTTNDPMFRSVTDGNFKLLNGSPCINTGTNQPWMDAAVDLDGRPRLDRLQRRVDMGCYEYMHHGTMFSAH